MSRQLLLDESRGIYIPLAFVLNFDWRAWNVSQEDLDTISNGPEDPEYWEAWDNVLRTAKFEQDGKTFYLEQDGDLFTVEESIDKESEAV